MQPNDLTSAWAFVADMNAYRTERCCRATCTRIADGMGLRRHVVTHACYIDLKGGRVPADSMIAEALEVTLWPQIAPIALSCHQSGLHVYTHCKP